MNRVKRMDRNRIQRMARTALLGSLALLLSYIETMIPLPFAVPGIKLGLANASILIALYSIDVRSAAAVALIKVLASGFLFGSPMMLAYSATGTLLSFASMLLLGKVLKLGPVPVSMASAICHNAGQLIAASVMLSSTAVFLTLPLLAIAACVTGAVIGCVAQGVISALLVEEPQRREVDLSALELVQGEHIAFVGSNGSGKTTAALQLAGLVGDCGAGAKLTFQDPDDQIVKQRVRDDVAFGCENMGIELNEMRHLVATALREAGVDVLAERDVAKLSGGQKQRVAIAGVLAMTPHLIVFDEATSMQDAAARMRFSRLVDDLNVRGVTVVTVTQIPDEAACADRVAVFDDCHLVEVLTGEEYAQKYAAKAAQESARVKKHHQVGAIFAEGGVAADNRIQNRRSQPCDFACNRAGQKLAPTWHAFSQGGGCQAPVVGQTGSLNLKSVSYRYPDAAESVVEDVSIAILCNRVIGLSGPSGCGKSTIAQIASGYLEPGSGEVLLDGKAMGVDRISRDAFRRNVAYVAQTPEKALFATTAFEDVLFGALNCGLDEQAAQTAAELALRSVGIDPEAARTKSPFAYSGGEKRRIALAGMLVLDTPYLIFDEPNAGLDPREVDRLAALIRTLAEDGKGIMVISHDDGFLDACCDSRVTMGENAPLVAQDIAASKQTAGFGVYQPGDSLMHCLNPQIKLVAITLFMVAGFVASGWLALGLCALFSLVMLAASRTSLRQGLRALAPFAFLMVFVGVFDALFVCSGDIWWQAGPIALSSGGIVFATESVVRFALVALGASTLMRTTSAAELADACSALLMPFARFGLHVDDLALSLSMTLRFIPLVQEEFFDVKRAQEARLASFNASNLLARAKAYVPVLTPLFNSCLRRSMTLALAIENRTYGEAQKRTCYRQYHLGRADATAIVVVLALLALTAVL